MSIAVLSKVCQANKSWGWADDNLHFANITYKYTISKENTNLYELKMEITSFIYNLIGGLISQTCHSDEVHTILTSNSLFHLLSSFTTDSYCKTVGEYADRGIKVTTDSNFVNDVILNTLKLAFSSTETWYRDLLKIEKLSYTVFPYNKRKYIINLQCIIPQYDFHEDIVKC